MTDHDAPSSDAPERLFQLFCQNNGETWTVMVGPGWLPPRLLPFFNEDFETGQVLLDFDYLQHLANKRGVDVAQQPSHVGDVELTARGEAATLLAGWFGTAVASSLQPVR